MNWKIGFRQLEFGYGGGPLLFDRLDWEVPLAPSEVLAVLGRSGSGKSTILELLAGLKRPRNGAVLLDGEDVTSLKPSDRRVVMMYQERSLFPGSVRFNIDFALRCRRVPAGERKLRIKSLLNLVGLERYEGKSVDALSGGERQRIELARALAAEPRLLLLDEPLGQLDGPLKKDLVEQIRAWVKSQRVRAVYVTHDTSEAFAVADRIAVLHDGRLTAPRAPAETYRDPATLAEAQLTGGLNTLRGTVETSGRGSCAVRLENGVLVEIQTSAAPGTGQQLLICFRPTAGGRRPGDVENSASEDGLSLTGVMRETRLVEGLPFGVFNLLDAPQVTLHAALPSDLSYEEGSVVEFIVPPAGLLLFSAQGERVRFGGLRTIRAGGTMRGQTAGRDATSSPQNY